MGRTLEVFYAQDVERRRKGMMKHSAGVLVALLLLVVVGTGNVLADKRRIGRGSLDFSREGSFEPAPPERGFGPGRLVALQGIMNGFNFEPGTCNPDTDQGSFPGKCPFFTTSEPVLPGQFKRAFPGQRSFTLFEGTFDDKTGMFFLDIVYPLPDEEQVTHFTIRDAEGDLRGLQGSGSLQLSGDFAYELRYRFGH